MVKQSNYVLVVWNGKPGGARKILSFARTLGKIVIQIDPITFEVRTDLKSTSDTAQ
ncbi:hypothetical protein [Desulfosporosinus metallidurans]|uniref:Uncharacterized protein n=1 Tax=Desulfosporosinus metallidurans TaxID=1888891 RepID=A0A1Q8QKS7_9FIRM|nr:hypothetical protein [Desulfosporosinus metallidurans]OLN27936.1 hypothetical protein DSOL_4295 [Desulfosporosinus metallidurans]